MSEEKEQVSKAQDMMREVHEDKCATINGRDYVITPINHIRRRKVFAYFTHIQNDLMRQDMWFLDSPDWREVEKIIEDHVTYDDIQISKRSNHWEEFPEDYILFVQTMMGALSYPFLSGINGG